MAKYLIALSVLISSSTVLSTCTAGGDRAIRQKVPSFVDIVENGRSEFFTVPFDRYKAEMRELPIGVFDSGIGGLTVLSAILKLDAFDNTTGESGPDGRPDFEHERFVYLGDQANMPYGLTRGNLLP